MTLPALSACAVGRAPRPPPPVSLRAGLGGRRRAGDGDRRLLKHDNLIGLKTILPPLKSDGFKDLYIINELMETDLSSIIKSPQPLSDEHVQFFLYQVTGERASAPSLPTRAPPPPRRARGSPRGTMVPRGMWSCGGLSPQRHRRREWRATRSLHPAAPPRPSP